MRTPSRAQWESLRPSKTDMQVPFLPFPLPSSLSLLSPSPSLSILMLWKYAKILVSWRFSCNMCINWCLLFDILYRLSVEKAVASLNKSLEILTDEHGYPTDARRAVGERVCLTLVQECSEQALEEFFISRINTIMRIVESKLSRVSHY